MTWSDASAPDGPARDIYTDRRKDLQRSTARTAEATTIGTGGINVTGGGINVTGGDIVVEGTGSVFVRGTGGVTVEQGARIVAEYPDGSPAMYFGALRNSADQTPMGTGLLTRRNSGALIAMIFEGQDGVAVAAFDVDGFDVDAVNDIVFDAGGDAHLHGDVLAQITSVGQAALAGQAGSFILREDTGLSANMYMDSAGRVFRSTSSIRYKTDVRDLPLDPDAVLRLKPRSWLPKPAAPRCPDWLHDQHGDDGTCPALQGPPPPDPVAERVVGFVAEELVEAGLADFVEFVDGEPESIRYDRLTAALVPLLQRQQEQIDALAEKIEQLTSRVQEHAPEGERRGEHPTDTEEA